MKSDSDKALPRVRARVEDIEPGARMAWHYAHDDGPDDARFQEAIAAQLSTLPVFPLYDIKAAAPLVGKTYGALTSFLKDHKDKFPPRYRTYKGSHKHSRLVRVLTAREVLLIRTYTLKGPGRFTQ